MAIKETDIKNGFIGWLWSQGTSTVLLIMQTSLFIYCVYYAVATAIPSHLKAIQDGYDRQATIYAQIRKDDREATQQLITVIQGWRMQEKFRDSSLRDDTACH